MDSKVPAAAHQQLHAAHCSTHGTSHPFSISSNPPLPPPFPDEPRHEGAADCGMGGGPASNDPADANMSVSKKATAAVPVAAVPVEGSDGLTTPPPAATHQPPAPGAAAAAGGRMFADVPVTPMDGQVANAADAWAAMYASAGAGRCTCMHVRSGAGRWWGLHGAVSPCNRSRDGTGLGHVMWSNPPAFERLCSPRMNVHKQLCRLGRPPPCCQASGSWPPCLHAMCNPLFCLWPVPPLSAHCCVRPAADDTGPEADDAADPSAAAAAQQGVAGAAQQGAVERLPFYYVDAYENPDAKPGACGAKKQTRWWEERPAGLVPASTHARQLTGRQSCQQGLVVPGLTCWPAAPWGHMAGVAVDGGQFWALVALARPPPLPTTKHVPTHPPVFVLLRVAGEAILFGKVLTDGRWQSASVVVRGLQRCLMVVPKPEVRGAAGKAIRHDGWLASGLLPASSAHGNAHPRCMRYTHSVTPARWRWSALGGWLARQVFEDGDGSIARLEAAAKEDPTRRPELLKLLHVSTQEAQGRGGGVPFSCSARRGGEVIRAKVPVAGDGARGGAQAPAVQAVAWYAVPCRLCLPARRSPCCPHDGKPNAPAPPSLSKCAAPLSPLSPARRSAARPSRMSCAACCSAPAWAPCA